MGLKNLFFVLLCIGTCACSQDEEEYITTHSNHNENSHYVANRSVIRSSSNVMTWTGEIKTNRSRRVKKVFGPDFSSYIPAGIYICYEYTVEAYPPEDNSIIYKSVVDNACGFMPKATSKENIQRGTRAIKYGNSYILRTLCYEIICRSDGATPSKPLFIPCRPEDVVLKYKPIKIAE